MQLFDHDITLLSQAIAQEVLARIGSGSSPGRWLTLREAMEYARVKSRTTMLHWINEGYVYAFKRSGDWIVDRQSIDDWYLSEKF